MKWNPNGYVAVINTSVWENAAVDYSLQADGT
jgi:hypothetical protein